MISLVTGNQLRIFWITVTWPGIESKCKIFYEKPTLSTWNKQTIVRPQWSWWDIEGVSWSLWSNKVEIRHLLKLYYWIWKAYVISWRAVILSLKYNRSLQLDQTSNPWLSKIYCRQWHHKLFQPFNPDILSVILHNVCFTMFVIAWRIWYCHAFAPAHVAVPDCILKEVCNSQLWHVTCTCSGRFCLFNHIASL